MVMPINFGGSFVSCFTASTSSFRSSCKISGRSGVSDGPSFRSSRSVLQEISTHDLQRTQLSVASARPDRNLDYCPIRKLERQTDLRCKSLVLQQGMILGSGK